MEKRFFLLNSKGQSLVEYVMLLAVLVSLSSAIFKKFKDQFGPDSTMVNGIAKQFQYSYQFGLTGLQPPAVNYSGNPHPSYLGAGKTRFFTASEPYPEQ